MGNPRNLSRRGLLTLTAALSTLPWLGRVAPAAAATSALLGAVSKHPVGKTKLYTSVSPAVFVTRTAANSWTAFTNVCTHEGAKVALQGSQAVCPLHGAVFNARTGKPVSGPVSRSLRTRKISTRNGKIYVSA